jgi:hypothetical protein
LRKREVCGDFYGNDLCNRGHKEKCSLPKSAPASSGTVDWMSRAGQRALRESVLEHCADEAFWVDTTPGLPGDSNRRRML